MNSRERVLTALSHREPDRVPFDLGGTVVTGIHHQAYAGLRAALGLPAVRPVLVDVVQQLAQVDDDVMDRLQVDVRPLAPLPPAGYELTLAEEGDYTFFYDQFGIGWRSPKEGGWYYDMFDHPLAGSITEAEAASFPLPDPLDPARFAGLRERALRVREHEQRALVFHNISAGLFEMFSWLRGYADAYADWGSDSPVTRRLLDRILQMQLAYLEQGLALVGDIVDVVMIADDVAGQNAMLISPRSYRRLLKPLHKQLCDFIHAHSGARVFMHSCGAVRAVLPDLIEVGVEILNPVQVSAAGMDSAELKREFGRDLVFWGGGVDTQRVLGDGTPDEVAAEVRRRVADLKPGGGFVFNTVHNIQGNVPPENLLAMWHALREFGEYTSVPVNPRAP